MFQKKIALFGLAGLTAFAMSCSDDGSGGGGDKGGEFTEGLSIAESTYGELVVFAVNGKIEAFEGRKIDAITATVNNETFELEGTLPAATFDLVANGQFIIFPEELCEAADAGKKKTIKAKVTVKFSEGGSISDDDSKDYTCGSGSSFEDVGLPVKKLEVGSEGSTLGSFAELDFGGMVYKKDEITATNYELIDIAYWGSKIGTLMNDGAPNDWAKFREYDPDDDKLLSDIAVIIPITAFDLTTAQENSLSSSLDKAKIPLEDLYEFLGVLPDPEENYAGFVALITDNGVDNITVPATGALLFAVLTTESDFALVKVDGKTTTKVDLKFITDADDVE